MGICDSKQHGTVAPDDDYVYEAINGMSGLNEILLRLCQLMWKDIENVKSIIGMCKEHIIYRFHPSLMELKRAYAARSFRANLQHCYAVQHARCTFATSFPRTLFLKAPITEGIWRWTLQIEYADKKPSILRIGAMSSNFLMSCEGSYIGHDHGSSFRLANRRGSLSTALDGVIGADDMPLDETRVPNFACVAVEADIATRSLCFFVDGQRVPRAVSHMVFFPSAPLHLGVSQEGRPAFTPLSLCFLQVPTRADGACKFYKSEHENNY